MKKFFVLAAMIAVSMVGSAKADLIANWTFEGSVPTTAGPHLAEGGLQAGTAVASAFHASVAVVYSNPVGNGSGESFSSNNWSVDDYYQFQFSMVGLENATFQWDQTRSSTGPADFSLQWSIDNTNFTSILDYTVGAISWSSLTNNPDSTFAPVALPTAVNGQASVYVRLSNNSIVGTGGTNRIDNLQLNASVIPEPQSALLLAAGAAILIRLRKRT